MESELQSGILAADNRARIKAIDSILKEKVALSLGAYKKRIEQGDKSSDYLKAVLLDLDGYGKDEPKSKWWYHLLDDHV